MAVAGYRESVIGFCGNHIVIVRPMVKSKTGSGCGLYGTGLSVVKGSTTAHCSAVSWVGRNKYGITLYLEMRHIVRCFCHGKGILGISGNGIAVFCPFLKIVT